MGPTKTPKRKKKKKKLALVRLGHETNLIFPHMGGKIKGASIFQTFQYHRTSDPCTPCVKKSSIVLMRIRFALVNVAMKIGLVIK